MCRLMQFVILYLVTCILRRMEQNELLALASLLRAQVTSLIDERFCFAKLHFKHLNSPQSHLRNAHSFHLQVPNF